MDQDEPTERGESAGEVGAPMRTLLDTSSIPDLPDATMPRGAAVGRYVVLEKLGAGAMGVVYSAFDPELARKVALKLVRPRPGRRSKRARDRLLREAQAMARVDHRNVIEIHDVGTHHGRVFLAMEYVRGTTLREWQESERRTWEEVVAMYEEAGRGLEAAHRSGLVHRDFKPENALVGKDGRVRVLDFGIARVDGDELEESADPERPREATPSSLTRTGALMGTPAYMAPEQHLGQLADARSDQFAFCVALWEALFGERPFGGEDAAALAFQVCHGEIRSPPPSAVPAAIRKALTRGLTRDAEARWPDMGALLGALGRGVEGRRRGIGWVAGAGIAAALAGAFWVAASEDPCAGAAEKLGPVLNAERLAKIEAAFGSTGRAFAAETYARTHERLEAWGQGWSAERTRVCEATRVRRESSDRAMDLRMRCLDRQLDGLDATLDVFEDADETVLQSAVAAVAALGRPSACTDLAETLPSSDAAPTDAEQEHRLDAAAALGSAGKFGEARDLALAVTEAEPEGTTAARAWLLRGTYEGRGGESDAAMVSLREALRASESSSATTLRARAWIELVRVTGLERLELDAAGSLVGHAEDAVERIEGATRLEGELLRHAAKVNQWKGELELAESAARNAVESSTALFGDQHPEVAEAWSVLGVVLRDAARWEAAIEAQQHAVELLESTLGSSHPDVGRATTNLGNTFHAQGDYESALAAHRRALELFRGSLGEDHVYVAKTMSNEANALFALRRYEEAAEIYRAGVARLEAAVGKDAAVVAISLDNLGQCLGKLERPEEAIEASKRALAIRKRSLGDDHVEVGLNLDNLGLLLQQLEPPDFDGAMAHHEKALEIVRAARGDDHPDLVAPSLNLAQELLRRERSEEAKELLLDTESLARTHLGEDHEAYVSVLVSLGEAEVDLGTEGGVERLERALELALAREEPGDELAFARFSLAAALAKSDKPRARELANLALEYWSGESGRHVVKRRRAEVSEFLAALR